jgi:hypothetical protein
MSDITQRIMEITSSLKMKERFYNRYKEKKQYFMSGPIFSEGGNSLKKARRILRPEQFSWEVQFLLSLFYQQILATEKRQAPQNPSKQT